jgi:5-oxoprolinase (ATP-hydrolysing)
VAEIWKVRADTGGTFTDAWALSPSGQERRCKVLSDGSLVFRIADRKPTNWIDLGKPHGLDEASLIGFEAENAGKVIAESNNGRWLQLSLPLTSDRLVLRTGEEAPVVAARLLTGTPVGIALPPMDFRVATTRGTNALLERKGARTVLFVTKGFGDLLEIRDQRRAALFSLNQPVEETLVEGVCEIAGRLDAHGNFIEKPDEASVRSAAKAWLDQGIEVAAVAILHAWKNPEMENRIAAWLLNEGFSHVTTSSGVAPVIRFLPRLETAVADAWLAPIMRQFTGRVAAAMGSGEPWMMTSAGGLVAASRYQPKDSLLSGPAGGLVGAAAVARAAGFPKVLTFDMGGTSTDVARIDGPFAFRYEQEIGPARVLAPALKIETVAAGGGSICRWHLGRLEVGPESAGSIPGPACYGRGGPLTVTDVNLLLGLMNAEGAGIPLDEKPARDELRKVMAAMKNDGVDPGEEFDLLTGLRSIAVEKMAEAIRSVSLAEGHAPENFALFAFGGAGPQHACAVAERLGISTVLVPGDAGLLSAWGLNEARRQEQEVRQILKPLHETGLQKIWSELANAATEKLGIPRPAFRWLIQLRLLGQDTPIDLEATDFDESESAIRHRFAEAYETLYGYLPSPSRIIECVTLRVIAEEAAPQMVSEQFGEAETTGPKIFQDRFSTCVLPNGWSLRRGDQSTLLLEKQTTNDSSSALSAMDGEIRAALFRSRFEGLVTEMGTLIRRTALSANIKERLDYSCALLDPNGKLIVNAPHVPVHLGALGVCVREVATRLDLQPGDVAVTNHPAAGGSHLPDVTVIAAAFDAEGKRIGYVANRAHHAEIGGMAPGSMPAAARCLAEEGVVISPMKWIETGVMKTGLIESLLLEAPYPSRRPAENIADLEAQVASVAHGVTTLESLAAVHGGDVVRDEMSGILNRSEKLMRGLLSETQNVRYSRDETLDDGTKLAVSLSVHDDQLTVDFTGSGNVHPRNLNATPAIVRSVLLYVLRLWLDEDVPLNEGLLEPVEIVLPTGFLNPEFPEDPLDCPAVVGGNVETSQRLTDLLLAALGLCAHGPGTMNNFLFGNDRFGYYETIAGGAGAGPGFDGKSSRHVHMTNTAITDPEILEHRFPVRLHRFAKRTGSGGTGKYSGGDGVIREIEFLEPMTVSFLTERRLTCPEGMNGGSNGKPGSQTRIKISGESEPLPGAITYSAEAGERVIIETPGGGGWEY